MARAFVAQSTLLLLLIVCPLCFGALEPWSLFVLEAGSVVVSFLWIAASWRSARIQLDLPTGCLLLFGCLGVVQIGTGLSIYRYATQQELLKVFAYFLCFFLARHLFATHEARVLAGNTFAAFGALLAIFAIVQKLQGNGRIYWLRTSSTPNFFGPYANKNHYAGLLEMLIPFALMSAVRTRSVLSQRILFIFSAAVMVASVFLSGSRAGSAIVIFELVMFAGIIMRASRLRGRGLIFSSLYAVSVVVFVGWLAGDAFLNEGASLREPSADASVINRRQLTIDSLKLIKQRPGLGWGLGSFSVVYPQAASWYGDSLVNAAHDDYLQLLVETGVLGLSLMMIFIGLIFFAGLRRMARAPTSVISAGLLACCGLLLHSFTDFNLHVPANAAMFFFLCGLICAGTEIRRRGVFDQSERGVMLGSDA